MMDLSDGLSTDLGRLCQASGVGAKLSEEALPCVALPERLRRLSLDPLALALHGGEDYGLLFTVPKRSVKSIPKTFRGSPLTQIGEITSGQGVRLVGAGGRESQLEPGGWDHFRRSSRSRKHG
jgi:thiamine-monophosphate kinase